MAPLKLSYFNGPALGEPIRYILSYGGIEFVDDRFNMEEFLKKKESFPYGKVPVMEIDGKMVHQTKAMSRYFAKKVGVAGKTEWEALEVDIMVDTIDDFRAALASFSYEKNEEAKAKKREEVMGTQVPYYLGKFEKHLADNGGHFLNGQVTWADFYFCSMVDYFHYMTKEPLLNDRPHLSALVKKIDNLPKIKQYLEKRPPFVVS